MLWPRSLWPHQRKNYVQQIVFPSFSNIKYHFWDNFPLFFDYSQTRDKDTHFMPNDVVVIEWKKIGPKMELKMNWTKQNILHTLKFVFDSLRKRYRSDTKISFVVAILFVGIVNSSNWLLLLILYFTTCGRISSLNCIFSGTLSFWFLFPSMFILPELLCTVNSHTERVPTKMGFWRLWCFGISTSNYVLWWGRSVRYSVAHLPVKICTEWW